MRKSFKIFFCLLTFVALLSHKLEAQETIPITPEFELNYLNDSARNEIGVGCGYAGSPTENVWLICDLIHQEHYDILKKLLLSKIPATKYLSALTLQIAEEKGKIKLDSLSKNKIEWIKKSEESVFWCSGCTEWGNSYPIQKLFGKPEVSIAKQVRNRIKESFEKNEKKF